jgi:uncharacterized OsmC-like protein
MSPLRSSGGAPVHGRNGRRRSVRDQPDRPREHRALDLEEPQRGTVEVEAGIGPIRRPLAYDQPVSHIGDAVAQASAYLAEHPAEARYRDAAAHARLGTGLRVDITGPGGEELATDMPRGIGGEASLPSPGWFFRAAAASCVASLIGIRAATLGVALADGDVEVVVDSESDDRGILGLDDGVVAGALSLKVVVRIGGTSLGREARTALARWALDHCPVTDTAQRAVPIELELA